MREQNASPRNIEEDAKEFAKSVSTERILPRASARTAERGYQHTFRRGIIRYSHLEIFFRAAKRQGTDTATLPVKYINFPLHRRVRLSTKKSRGLTYYATVRPARRRLVKKTSPGKTWYGTERWIEGSGLVHGPFVNFQCVRHSDHVSVVSSDGSPTSGSSD